MPRDYSFDAQNIQYVEWMWSEYLRDKNSVPPVWQRYFGTLPHDNGVVNRPIFPATSLFHARAAKNGQEDSIRQESERLQDRADQLVRAYRVRGHLAAKLDPLGFVREEPKELDFRKYGLTNRDLDQPIVTSSVGGPETQTLRELIKRLRATYCRYIGAQFMHIDEPHVRDWLQLRMEESENRIELSRDDQLHILTRLTDAVIFEQFVRKKYVGAKTFSLEGAESLIPLLAMMLEKAVAHGMREVVMGMAHRGRLNVLANIIGKSPREIFWEFEDAAPDPMRGRGDVKYHLGFSGEWTARSGGQLHVSLCFNPSHLEYINSVAQGRMRAKQDRVGDTERRQGMVVLVHGDASFAAEGVVQESLNLSQLAGYATGGTIHVIVNNQLGFTTSPGEGRSTPYPTDVARMLQIPIFHVNGEHPESVAQVVQLAMEFHRKFQRDVVIDLFCFRRWGHNESDEPGFTQPLLYQAIEHRPSVRDNYLEHLLELGGMSRSEADEIAARRLRHLSDEFDQVHKGAFKPPSRTLAGVWKGYLGGSEPADDDVSTGVPLEQLKSLLEKLADTPRDFHLHRKLQRLLEQRRKMAEGKISVDWSAAEALAIATLAMEQHRVRLSGQDSQRGTFSQRHAVWHDVVDGRPFHVFQHIATGQAPVDVINSPLSEAGVLGFDYGYSLDYPEALVIWEAQYGDFCNAGQVIIDQFISSAEDKWQRLSGLTMLLPHGFEGQGPEHSSARLERFLTLAAEHNLQVVIPSTAAQYFHCLRRQVKRRWRKPLIVMTPKSLLRHPQVASPMDELIGGKFLRVYPDQRSESKQTSRVLLCSGKVYYELFAFREEQKRFDTAIVRIEQLYPLEQDALIEALQVYPANTPMIWVQEEPENMGAWRYWRSRFGDHLLGRYPLSGVSRPESAASATGSKGAHEREHAELLESAFEEPSK